ncbi:MAG: hypothetical protein KGZ68_04705 [Dechloromonas sp.]|nr:hypothetical protein [Dechloromonas sp.]
MAAGNTTIYSANKDAINIDDLLGATVKIALLSSSYVPDVGTSGHDTWADVSAHEITGGSGYTPGGATLVSLTKTAVTNGWKLSSSNAVWTAAGGNIPAWRYGVLYVEGALWGVTDPLLGYFLGDTTPANVPATTDGYPLTVNCPTAGWIVIV